MPPLEDVYVVGVGMYPINNDRVSVRDMHFAAAMGALQDANLRFDQVEYVYNAYRPADPFVNGIELTKDLGLTGAPITQVENASATGTTAFREAVLKVASGTVNVAMANGTAATEQGGDFTLGEAAGIARQKPKVEGMLLPNAFFAMWAVRRMHEVGTTVETFAAITAKNWNHALTNPYARRRADHEVTVDEVLAARKIVYPHTSMMSAAVGGGAACAVVANKRIATALALEQGRPLVRVLASQMESERYVPGHIFSGAIVGPSELTRTTSWAAYEQAGVGPTDLSLVHVHDAFPVEELLYMELLGLCGDGEADKLVADGATTIGGRIPFSTDGGLIARGHPRGPTGLAQ